MRKHKGAGSPYREQLDPCGEGPSHASEVSETQKREGRQEGDCRHSSKAPYQDMGDAFT